MTSDLQLPLRVAIVSSATEAWGAEESLLILATRLAAHGVSPHLFSSNRELLSRWTDVGLRGEFLSPSAKTLIGRSRQWIKRVSETSPSFDMVVVFNLDLAPIAALARFTAMRGVPFVLDLHDYLPTRMGRMKLWFSARFFSSVIAISDFSANQVRPHRRLAIIQRPVEFTPIEPFEHTDSARRVGIVGRIDPDKGIEVAVDAMKLLPLDVVLVVKGTSTSAHAAYGDRVRRYASKELGDRVVFTGRVTAREVMSGLGVLVVTNSREALGRTVREAQLVGVPAVVPSVGGAAEMVRDGVSGFHYRADDAGALATAISAALAADEAVIQEARQSALVASDPQLYARRYASALDAGTS